MDIKLTVNAGKEIAMTTKTKNGEMVRDYFLLMLEVYKKNKIKLGFTKDFKVCSISKNEVKKLIYTNKPVRQELIEIETIIKSCMEVTD